MCVAAIIYGPVLKAHLKLMQEANPHGAGVAWCHETAEGKSIAWVKGIDADAIWDLQESGAIKYPYLLHFRWATHGPKVPELAHPFPLGSDAFFHAVEGESQSVLIHNGVWHSYEKHIPPWLNAEVHPFLSDTQVAAYVAYSNEDILNSVQWATAIMRIKDGELKITSRGRWMDYGKNSYSNLGWLPYKEHPGYTPWVPSKKYKADKPEYNKYTHGNKPKEKEAPPAYYTSPYSPYSDYDGDYYSDSIYWDQDGRGGNGDTCKMPHYPGTQEAPQPKKLGLVDTRPKPPSEEALERIEALFTKEELDPRKNRAELKEPDPIFLFNGQPCSWVEYQQLRYGTTNLTPMNEDSPDEEGEDTLHMTDEELVDLLLQEREMSGVADLVSEDPQEVNAAVKELARQALKRRTW